MTLDEERKYIKLAQNGDEDAFELLLIATQNEVYALALRMLGNSEDAQDASQDAFLRAFTAISRFRGDSRFSVWMYRITYNICLDKLRKARRGKTVSFERDNDEPDLQLVDDAPTPEERAEAGETARLVRQGLDTLPPKLRGVLIMREVSELSYAEIAKATGLREGTVKSRISRARDALAEYLRQNGTFPESQRQTNQRGGR